MLLTDGRRLVSAQIEGASAGRTERTIPIHPVRLKPLARWAVLEHLPTLNSMARAGLHAQDFRMIVLANRPGFPFLGNDFYREIGDVFSGSVLKAPPAFVDTSSRVSETRRFHSTGTRSTTRTRTLKCSFCASTRPTCPRKRCSNSPTVRPRSAWSSKVLLCSPPSLT